MTNTYKTLNPLGSNNARDLSDNASNLDEYMNSDSPSIKDRFDKRRQTLAGNQAAFDAAQEGRDQEFTDAQAERETEFNDMADRADAAAEAAKTAAESANTAAESAKLASRIFPNTASGILATTDGQYFSVPSPDSDESLILYKNNSGVPLEIDRYPNSASVKNLQDVVDTRSDLSSLSESVFIIKDSDKGRIAIEVTAEGKTNLGGTKDVGGKAALVPGLVEETEKLKQYIKEMPEYNQSGYSLPLRDTLGRVACGIDTSGDWLVRGLSVNGRLTALESSPATSPEITKWVNGSSSVVCGGDSLTEGAGASSNPYPKQLSGLLGRTVVNMGVAGQNPQQIATRQGGYINFLTVASNTIPASGAVDVTASTQTPITSQGGNNMVGTLGGIPGTLTATFDGTTRTSLKFTRATAGVATVIDPATPFIPELGDNEFCINVLWSGRNAFWTGRTDFVAAKAEVKAALSATIANFKAVNKKFVVMSILTDNKEAEWAGTEKYAAITSLNEELKVLYPRNFIDIRRVLVRAYDPNKPQDVIDYGHDVTPTSLLSDTLHLNLAGYALVANTVYNFIIQKGW